jgi:hypothetical protein
MAETSKRQSQNTTPDLQAELQLKKTASFLLVMPGLDPASRNESPKKTLDSGSVIPDLIRDRNDKRATCAVL